MKITILLLLCIVIQSNASIYSQNTKLSVDMKDATIDEILVHFDKQSEFQFFYQADLFENEAKMSVREKDILIEEFLKNYLEPNGYQYEIKDKTIILSKAPKTEPNAVKKEDGDKVGGKVTDSEGVAMPGVTITVLGQTKGVITDIDGKFEITGIKPNDKLVFSFIGMESQIVDVGNQTKFKVVLKEKAEELDDITVVAFGKQKKESVIASIETVDVSDLKVPSSNLTTALAGQMSGIISYQRSGEPGEDNAEFFVRGVTTFGYKKDPLILIDGVELTSDDLARLQTDDIASFSIMKDATATALYGARGANGVILVTTKEGKEGKAKVSVRYESSLSAPTQEVDLADPITYMKMHNEAVKTRNPFGTLPYSRDKIEQTIAGGDPNIYPVTDWYNMLFKDHTLNQRLNFNVNGGGKVARYYMAASYTQDNGILKVDNRNNFNNNINLNKYLLRSNINVNLSKTTEVVFRFQATMDDYEGPLDGGSGLYNKVMRTNPVLFPAYFEPDEANKYKERILFGNYDQGNYINPYADMVKGYKDKDKSRLLAQFEIKQDLNKFVDGLSARAMFNMNRISEFDISRFYKPYYYTVGAYDKDAGIYELDALNPDEGTDYLEYDEGDKKISKTYYAEVAVNYNKKFAEKNNVSGLLVFTAREKLNANPGSLEKSLPYRNMGLSGRFTYSYDSRYFAEFNFGYNGSERFSEDSRFGFFPSAGLGYLISNEPFWSNIEHVISKLKFKGTYGMVGNDAIGSADDRFFYLSNVNMSDGGRGARFGTFRDYKRDGISIKRYENPDVSWETAYKLNVGFEMQLYKSLDIQADYFHERRENILMSRASIPQTMGLEASLKANVGKAKAQGFDMSVDYNKRFSNGMWMTGRGNFTYATSEYLFYEEPDYSSTPWRSKIGQKLGQQWGYIAERLFIDERDVANSPKQFGDYAAGDIKYRDINEDGKISDLDQVPIGYPTRPEIVYGAGLSFGYKNFDFSCFFQGSARSSFWIDVKKTSPFIDNDDNGDVISQNQLLQAYADDYWSESNRNIYALWPRLTTKLSENNSKRSTWFMHNGSFVRLKSVEMGYSLPKSFIKRFRLNQLRFYVSGSNLYTWSKFDLWDPENASNGLGYPNQRVINLGVKVGF
ncbi:SusC/RagA family TonB-linked outer membrane protein [Puteibacter caeruleilacunae]|nr:SusC/RagA family TonB-linked outer membrane protein [Puteibacter caeruleilacunae]